MDGLGFEGQGVMVKVTSKRSHPHRCLGIEVSSSDICSAFKYGTCNDKNILLHGMTK